jgi:hypothetical protein
MAHIDKGPESTIELSIRRVTAIVLLLATIAAVVICVIGVVTGLNDPSKELLIPFCLVAAPFCCGFGLMSVGGALDGLD